MRSWVHVDAKRRCGVAYSLSFWTRRFTKHWDIIDITRAREGTVTVEIRNSKVPASMVLGRVNTGINLSEGEGWSCTTAYSLSFLANASWD
jgi:hypothetical protein